MYERNILYTKADISPFQKICQTKIQGKNVHVKQQASNPGTCFLLLRDNAAKRKMNQNCFTFHSAARTSILTQKLNFQENEQ